MPRHQFAHWLSRLFRSSSAATRSGFRLRVEGLEDRITPAPFTVINTNDSGNGSLRRAIMQANSTAGPDQIIFDIASVGVHKINLLSALPAITETVTLDGTTQSGYTTDPIIVLNGASAGAGTNGLVVSGANASNCTIKGLVIQNFSGDGILLLSNGNTVASCFIGTNATATKAAGNGGDGVAILGTASNNTIGGLTSDLRNVISGNGAHGVQLQGSGVTGNAVMRNAIGSNLAGTFSLSNHLDGVSLSQGAHGNMIGVATAGNFIVGNARFGVNISGTGTNGNLVASSTIGFNFSSGVQIASGAANNTIGGIVSGAGNLISSNGANGVILTGSGVTGNAVQGNFIGSANTGAAPLPNRLDGVLISGGASGNTIGGAALGAANLISGNLKNGVNISGSGTSGNTVAANLIGVAFGGSSALANGASGVQITAGAANNTIGGTTSDSRNVISGNTKNGVLLTGAGVAGNTIAGNYIGLSSGGTFALANGVDGIGLSGGAANNTIGGTATGAGNVISGNTKNGVNISGAGTSGNALFGNMIGLNATDDGAIANGLSGVQIASGANANRVGGAASGAGNIISKNTKFGILINGANQTFVQGNMIGTDAAGNGVFGNGSHGVFVTGPAANSTIGGTATGAGNSIANNGGVGVLIGSDPSAGFKVAAGAGNAILGNSIFANTRLGIDLGRNNGVTNNDGTDADNGPNNLQNFATINSAAIIVASLQIQIDVSLTSVPNTTYRIEFFASTTSDTSGFGEGQTFLGFVNVTTNAAGHATVTGITFDFPAGTGTKITCTVTNLTTNSTSEFSHAATAV